MDLDLRRVAKALIQVDVADDTTSILMTCTREMLLNTNELSIPQLQYLVLSLDYHVHTPPYQNSRLLTYYRPLHNLQAG